MSYKTIKYDFFFTNHLDIKNKITDKLVDVENATIIKENHKIYNSFTFVSNGVYYDPTIISDFKNRIEVKYKIDDNDIVSNSFYIDSIDYQQNNNIKVYCKTLGYKYTKEKLANIIEANNIKEAIENITLDLDYNFDNLIDIPIISDVIPSDKNINEIILELSKITNFDYYLKNDNKIYVENKKVIKKDDEAIFRFSDIKDIEDFSTSDNKEEIRINEIVINRKEDENIVAKSNLIMDIKPSPQPCSPDSILNYVDENNKNHKIYPKKSFFYIYYSPLLDFIPQCNIQNNQIEKIVLENYKLENEYYFQTSGGIKEILEIKGTAVNYSFKENYNIVVFDEKISGDIEITYKTNCLYGIINNSETPKKINFDIKFLNLRLEYTHKIELNGYYPKPYNLIVSLVKDWGIDISEAINKNITISKYDFQNKVFVTIGSTTSDLVGEFNFLISDYGTYNFHTENQTDLHLDYYVNKFRYYMSDVGTNC